MAFSCLPNLIRCKQSFSTHPTILCSSQNDPHVQGTLESNESLGNQLEFSDVNALLISAKTWVQTCEL